MSDTPSPYGQICWFEVPVTDVSRASTFYSTVLGWDCNNLKGTPSPSGREKSVHMFSKGALNGAFLLMQDEDGVAKFDDSKKAVPIATFMVGSIEETTKKIEAAGGQVNLSVSTAVF
jgi:predicted enzyme related to lactoylglutathione lyase